MGGTFSSLLTTTDWNEEWKRFQNCRQHADDPSFWDERAKTFPVKHGSQEGYVERFLELAGVMPGETVLDMGCGTGALATPLAQRGNRVVACDFSRGMLDAMAADQRALGVQVASKPQTALGVGVGAGTSDEALTAAGSTDAEETGGAAGADGSESKGSSTPGSVEAHLMSWDDDWTKCGIGPKSVDVALASRSIATYDLQEALLKLDRTARRRVCVTLPCGPSPRVDERLLEAAGFGRMLGRDFLYAFNILASQGINPEVAYIPSTRVELFESFDDACAGLTKIVRDAVRGLVPNEEAAAIPERMRPWLEANLLQDERGYRLSEDRTVTWAFIAWNPRG